MSLEIKWRLTRDITYIIFHVRFHTLFPAWKCQQIWLLQNFVPKIDFATMAVKIFWEFLIFYEIFQLPQVKPRVVISIGNALQELPHKFGNDVKLGDFTKISKLHTIVASCPDFFPNKILPILVRNNQGVDIEIFP